MSSFSEQLLEHQFNGFMLCWFNASRITSFFHIFCLLPGAAVVWKLKIRLCGYYGLTLILFPNLLLLFQFWNLVRIFATQSTTPALFGGGLLGYVMYDVTHYYLHHGQPASDVPKNLKVCLLLLLLLRVTFFMSYFLVRFSRSLGTFCARV